MRGAATGTCGTTAAAPGIFGGTAATLGSLGGTGAGLAIGSDLGASDGCALATPGPLDGARAGMDGGRGNALRTGGGGVDVASP